MKPLSNKRKQVDTIQSTLRMPKELNDFILNLANKTGISKNSLILTKLWELAKNKNSN